MLSDLSEQSVRHEAVYPATDALVHSCNQDSRWVLLQLLLVLEHASVQVICYVRRGPKIPSLSVALKTANTILTVLLDEQDRRMEDSIRT
jgi:hypothetical protein